MQTNQLKTGHEFSYKRKITRNDILRFSEISQDKGNHHIELESKLLAHGLLIATLPTKLGGDLNFIAQTMGFHFIKAVYEDETITCIAKVEKLIEQKNRFKTEFSFRCFNESREVIMTGTTKGMIWK